MRALGTTQAQAAQTTGKDVWIKPEISRIGAGEAELGPTPLAPEGPIGMGS